MSTRWPLTLLVCAVLVSGAALQPALAHAVTPGREHSAAPRNELVSVRTDGKPPRKKASDHASTSSDGRYVAFSSADPKLVDGPGEPVSGRHCYVRDTVEGVTAVVDVASDGTIAPGPCYAPAISADGRFVSFTTLDNLAPGAGPFLDVFVRDLATGATVLVSADKDGGPSNFGSGDAAISADGSTVAFSSEATDLVDLPEPDTFAHHVYLRDLSSGVTTLVSRTPSGGYAEPGNDSPDLSGDGNLVVYVTYADDIVGGGTDLGPDIVLFDVAAGSSTLVSHAAPGQIPDGRSLGPAVSADGTVVVFGSAASNLVPGDTNAAEDIFRFDVASEAVTLVTRDRQGGPTNGDSRSSSVSADGDVVAFDTTATDVVAHDDTPRADVVVIQISTDTRTLVSHARRSKAPGDGTSEFANLSDDATVVAFESDAVDLVKGTSRPAVRVYASRLG